MANDLTQAPQESPTEMTLHNVSTSALVMDPNALNNIMKFADFMSCGAVTVPKHLQGKPTDCAAIIMQAMKWGFDPFAVAQKTHITQSGALGYESQIVNAAIIAHAPIVGRPEYEYLGDWSKILGKVKEMKSERSGGKYYVADWPRSDEEGLGIRCKVLIRGEATHREIEVMLSQAWPRFSTQWATDPKQQIAYLAVRKLARRDFPDVIMGVYTVDELEGVGNEPRERDITPRTATEFAEQAKPQPSQKIDRVQVLRDLEMVVRAPGKADQRVQELNDAWLKLGKDGRAAIGKEEYNRLYAIASAEDAEPVVPAQQEAAKAETPAPEADAAPAESGAASERQQSYAEVRG